MIKTGLEFYNLKNRSRALNLYAMTKPCTHVPIDVISRDLFVEKFEF